MSSDAQTTPAKSPWDMTLSELQAEIGKLQAVLFARVCGSASESVIVRVGPQKDEPNLPGSHLHAR